jgi:hypothetical protein
VAELDLVGHVRRGCTIRIAKQVDRGGNVHAPGDVLQEVGTRRLVESTILVMLMAPQVVVVLPAPAPVPEATVADR